MTNALEAANSQTVDIPDVDSGKAGCNLQLGLWDLFALLPDTYSLHDYGVDVVYVIRLGRDSSALPTHRHN